MSDTRERLVVDHEATLAAVSAEAEQLRDRAETAEALYREVEAALSRAVDLIQRIDFFVIAANQTPTRDELLQEMDEFMAPYERGVVSE